jgi:transcriptional regulator with XRE-family HTH domain
MPDITKMPDLHMKTGRLMTKDPATPLMPKQTTDVDRLVGLRITALRKARGLSQTALGNAVGVTFQQVQKYEKGQNRVGAGRLREIARLLEVPVSAFFDDAGSPESPQEDVFGFLNAQGAVELLRAYTQIEDDQMRRDVLALVRSAARLAHERAHGADSVPPV